MNLEKVCERFPGRDYILYGGDSKIVDTIQKTGKILIWYTVIKKDSKSTVRQQDYEEFYSNIKDIFFPEKKKKDISEEDCTAPICNAIFLIVGYGNVGGVKAEIFTNSMMASWKYGAKILIFHGYPEFVTGTSLVAKQAYKDGCIVGRKDDHITTLQDLASIFKRNECADESCIPVPFDDTDFNEDSPMMEIMGDTFPYIHLTSRLKELQEEGKSLKDIETDAMPIDVFDLNNPGNYPQMIYDPNRWTSAVHWGQRKLLLSEIELFVEVISKMRRGGRFNGGRALTIIYVGSAPGSHIPYLRDLFTPTGVTLEFHLWDRPSRFDIQEDDQIRIVPAEYEDPDMKEDFKGFFTDVVARKYIQTYGTDNNILFISDIRDIGNDEEAINRDMRMQEGWVKMLNPYASQLKFRLPFERSERYKYLDGQVFSQAWSRVRSTEGRLLSYRPYREKEYDVNEYDRIMAYFNVYTRMSSYNIGNVLNQSSGKITDVGESLLLPEQGYCTCFDCAREAQIIGKYFKMLNLSPTKDSVAEFIRQNTLGSREKKKMNLRTLWNKVLPKTSPAERVHFVLFRQLPSGTKEREKGLETMLGKQVRFSEKSVLDLRIESISSLLSSGDGLSDEEIISLLRGKQEGKILWDTDEDKKMLMRSILLKRYPRVVVNFHTDFVPSYDSKDDTGKFGGKIYRGFQLDTFIRNREDPDKQFLLFLLSKTR